MTVKTNSGYNNYYFRKNIFGDILAVYNSSKTVLATYTYDAFGNASVTYANVQNNSARLNPFRYRGYYWDDELELYYLQSRYYDPEIGRFISPDSIEYINPSKIFGLNLYAYCNNNPIMNVDPTGKDWNSFWNSIGSWFSDNWGTILGVALVIAGVAVSILTFGATTTVAGIICGAVLGGAFGALSAYATGGDILMGALNGMIVGTVGAVSPVGSALAVAGMTFVSNGIEGKPVDENVFLKAVVNGIVAGGLSKGSSSIGNIIIGESKEIALDIITNVTLGIIFSAYSFVSDVINEKMLWKFL